MDVKANKVPHPFRKLSKELVDAIVKDIAEGSTFKFAAQANGISRRILQIWVLQGELDMEHGKEDTLPAYLVRSLAKVRADEVKWCRQQIRINEKGHGGAQWTLERAYWQDFGNQANAMELSQQLHDYNLDEQGKLNDEANSKDKK